MYFEKIKHRLRDQNTGFQCEKTRALDVRMDGWMGGKAGLRIVYNNKKNQIFHVKLTFEFPTIEEGREIQKRETSHRFGDFLTPLTRCVTSVMSKP